jgi:uncharacterized protein involved in outer membrane biogenesis
LRAIDGVARRRIIIGASILGGLAGLLLLLLAAFPWGILRPIAERALSRQFGRPVKIATMARQDHVSFHPTIVITGLRVPQAAWAGSGDLVRIDRATVRLAALPLLMADFRPDSVAIDGAAIDLVRDAQGRESWRNGPKRDDEARGGRPHLGQIGIRNATLRYRDAKRQRDVMARLAIDPAKGLVLDGDGHVRGTPVRLAVRGARLAEGRWPFRATIEGPALAMRFAGTMDHPLDIGHLDATVSARAANLNLVDAIVEAGLPRTQPVDLRATVRRDRPDWRVTKLSGTVGRSQVAGEATIGKRGGRHLIDATLNSARFDFDDLSDAEGRARAVAKRALFGRRLVPDTAIDLDNVARTDGTLRVHVAQLLWAGPSPFRSLDAVLKVDHKRLTIAPLRLGLLHGTMAGPVTVDQRKGGDPVLTTDLRLQGARLNDFVPDAGIDGRMDGVLKLAGPGRTVRAAIGRSTGAVAIVARDGLLPARTASLLGQDLAHGLFGGKDRQAELRCVIARFDVRGGAARPAPLLIDTSRAQSRFAGSIALADERMALTMRGIPKAKTALRLDGEIGVGGTIKAPDISLPGKGGAAGALLRSVGRLLSGDDGPVAGDADCDRLGIRALG